MIKPKVIVGLLHSLRERVEPLRSLQSLALRELTSDAVRWNGILHLLQVSIEHVTDIGAHLLAGSNAAVPDNHRQIIRKLGEMGILPLEFAERIAPMAGFGNIIVHRYLTVDPQKVGDILYNRLGDFDEFVTHIYDYLRRKGHLPAEDQTE